MEFWFDKNVGPSQQPLRKIVLTSAQMADDRINSIPYSPLTLHHD